MNVLIRLDSSPQIGTGHLMRCSALAYALKENKTRVIFLIRHVNSNDREYLTTRGFEVYNIENDLTWEEDAKQTADLIKNRGIQIKWMIVDHYELDVKWETFLRSYVEKIMVIDDLANRPHHCDVLLDQNFYADCSTRYCSFVPADTQLLLGPQYALLRPHFHHYRSINPRKSEDTKKILIFFGGGDYTNEVFKALQSCLSLKRKDIYVDVVVGANCSQQEKIRHLCHAAENTQYFCQPDNIAELMAQADLSIGAGGCTSWERCCLGLPSIVMTVAQNQVTLTHNLASLGVLKYLGDARQVSHKDLTDAIASLLDNPALLGMMRSKAQNLVDGLGCERVLKTLKEIQ